jgi:predicted DNA-binding transcriptional regulator AlpA
LQLHRPRAKEEIPNKLATTQLRRPTDSNSNILEKQMELLTVEEVATMLKMSKGQIYEMTKARTRTGSMKENPIPVLKINGNVHFRKMDVDAWLDREAERCAA